ncbi:MAG: TRAP transporter small permease, partial [Halocynthiibacter sp.]
MPFGIWMRRINEVPLIFASIILFVLMFMTFSDVLMRSILNNPIESATELTRLFMAIIVFSVLPLMSGQGAHIAVDLLDPLYKSQTLIRLREAAVALACGVMLFFPAQRVWVLAERARSYGDVTEYLNIPQYLIGWFIAAMTFLTAFVLLGRA